MARINEANRGKVMAAVRGRDTRPELTLRRAMWRHGITGYRCHAQSLPGSPDIAFTRYRLAIFVDGAFWHGHPEFIRSNATEYWRQKIARNIARDREVESRLTEMNWRTIRFWDFEVMGNCDSCLERIAAAIRETSGEQIAPVTQKWRDGPNAFRSVAG